MDILESFLASAKLPRSSPLADIGSLFVGIALLLVGLDWFFLVAWFDALKVLP